VIRDRWRRTYVSLRELCVSRKSGRIYSNLVERLQGARPGLPGSCDNEPGSRINAACPTFEMKMSKNERRLRMRVRRRSALKKYVYQVQRSATKCNARGTNCNGVRSDAVVALCVLRSAGPVAVQECSTENGNFKLQGMFKLQISNGWTR